MFFASPGVDIVVAWRSLRFRLDVFFVSMWLLCALRRLTLPPPVIENRLLAPLCDFIFGIIVIYLGYCWLPINIYLGAKIMVIDLPSNLASLSIFATSASSVATLSTT
jgi:hypothetical protein